MGGSAHTAPQNKNEKSKANISFTTHSLHYNTSEWDTAGPAANSWDVFSVAVWVVQRVVIISGIVRHGDDKRLN